MTGPVQPCVVMQNAGGTGSPRPRIAAIAWPLLPTSACGAASSVSSVRTHCLVITFHAIELARRGQCGAALSSNRMTERSRIPPGQLRELGPVNWAIAKLGARIIGAPRFHLFDVMGQHRRAFIPWVGFSVMLMAFGKLPRADTELVILRVAHLRRCQYELQQHRRLARRRGVDDALQEKIFQGPDAAGLTDRRRALLAATDEFVNSRSISSDTWAALSGHLDRQQLIEFCTLAGQYDALAATITTLGIPLDFPEQDEAAQR